MFCKVMTSEPEICKHLLELILDVKIRSVNVVESQKSIEAAAGTRGIRLDVYLEDEANSVYDIEMQTAWKHDLPRRSRYYQSMIDMNLIERGDRFNSLRQSFVIFICMFDPFGIGKVRYLFQHRCDEHLQLCLEDGTKRVFVNVTAWPSFDQVELQALLKYFASGIISDDYTKSINQSVDYIRSGEKWRTEYMTFEMKLQEVRDDAYQEGIEKGIEKGIFNGKVELLKGLVSNNVMSLAEAAEQMNVSVEEMSALFCEN